MFFRRINHQDIVRAGATFQRERPDHTVETAKVLSVDPDSFGIPHVRYELAFEKPCMSTRIVDGPRVLALEAFADTYKECVSNGSSHSGH